MHAVPDARKALHSRSGTHGLGGIDTGLDHRFRYMVAIVPRGRLVGQSLFSRARSLTEQADCSLALIRLGWGGGGGGARQSQRHLTGLCSHR